MSSSARGPDVRRRGAPVWTEFPAGWEAFATARARFLARASARPGDPGAPRRERLSADAAATPAEGLTARPRGG
jgi:hypothetical protein